jgi:hypothetical protein
MLEWIAAKLRRWRMRTLKPFGTAATSGLLLSLGDLSARVASALADAFADVEAVEMVQGT